LDVARRDLGVSPLMEERWEAILAKLADIVRDMPPTFRDPERQHAALR
jgi:hypothetical protein